MATASIAAHRPTTAIRRAARRHLTRPTHDKPAGGPAVTHPKGWFGHGGGAGDFVATRVAAVTGW
ncbi:hypothetical protein GCM10023170_009400 [Phytohabitans houttuyneae]|uniref:Uncharacterized protein n=1 Tax=Phytohabitans houttuyneae TaxID=1076126 RepID=A0A6V8KBH9_9ACTN|nr:hypothetical protein Phou_035060 [Phytohabitans houttuyneae]